jgi:hypothetical protein
MWVILQNTILIRKIDGKKVYMIVIYIHIKKHSQFKRYNIWKF